MKLVLISIFFVFLFNSISYSEDLSSGKEVISSSNQGYFLEDYKEPEIIQKKGLFRSVFDFSWKLAIVIGLIVLTIKGLKLVYNSKIGTMNDSANNFNMIDSFYIKPNQSIHIMEVAGKYLILGSSANSINLISEINDADQIKGLLKNSFSQSTSFKDAFKSLIGNKSELENKIGNSSENILNHLNNITDEG